MGFSAGAGTQPRNPLFRLAHITDSPSSALTRGLESRALARARPRHSPTVACAPWRSFCPVAPVHTHGTAQNTRTCANCPRSHAWWVWIPGVLKTGIPCVELPSPEPGDNLPALARRLEREVQRPLVVWRVPRFRRIAFCAGAAMLLGEKLAAWLAQRDKEWTPPERPYRAAGCRPQA